MLDVDALSTMMAGIISEEVEKAVAPLNARIAELEAREPVAGPPGEKGDPGEPGEKGADGNDGRDGADGKDGADGAGIADLLRDHDGNLVATFTDGRLKNLGPIQGKDGQNGRDGFELTDYDEWFEDDGRTLVRRFELGEDFKEFRHQTVLPRYRNVFKQGESYQRGDIVTWGGSAWHCEKDTTEKPDSADWSQMVKRGRDGKDAK